jgi:hypothetical protein
MALSDPACASSVTTKDSGSLEHRKTTQFIAPSMSFPG